MRSGSCFLATALAFTATAQAVDKVEPKTGVITNSIGMKLAYIPLGEFLMGSPSTEVGRRDDEQQHRVHVTKPFYMGVYETTQAQYQQVISRNPSYFSTLGGGRTAIVVKNTDQFPVEIVSWHDSVKFCNRLSKMENRKPYYKFSDVGSVVIVGGDGYRLPTEAEWEYACRAGTKTSYTFGDRIQAGEVPLYEQTDTDLKWPPNAFGLHDMHGGVREWCQDWYDETYYLQFKSGTASDPQGPTAGQYRVVRGGSWADSENNCRSAVRHRLTPTGAGYFIGFRVVRESP